MVEPQWSFTVVFCKTVYLLPFHLMKGIGIHCISSLFTLDKKILTLVVSHFLGFIRCSLVGVRAVMFG